jgi:glycosyltransferase involved in cell wall biosynthesis
MTSKNETIEGKQKVAVTTHTFSSFVETDCKMLAEHFDIKKVEFRTLKDTLKLFKAIMATDISLSWFVDIWSFLAVIFSKMCGKPSIVIAGGYDVACEPLIAYGQFNRNFIRRFWATFVLKHADYILSVSNFTKIEAESRTLPAHIKTIYNGVDTNRFKPHGPKNGSIITVASDTSAIALKGLETFVNVAKRCPSNHFFILGCSKQDKVELIRSGVPQNLTVLGKQAQNELLRFYQEADIYCQLSYRESFGMAMAEAMACGCVPVATERGALSEVVGKTGVLVPYASVDSTIEGIKLALTMSPETVRKQIVDNFTLDIRERELLHLFDFFSRDKCTKIRLQKSVDMANVQSEERILDLGCDNKILKALLPSDIEYTGVDLSVSADIQCDLELGLPQELKDNEYDIIFLNEFIEHIDNFKSLLIQCNYVLSKKGRIIISTPSCNRLLLFGDEDQGHIHCFRKTNMNHLARDAGLDIKDMCGTYISYLPFTRFNLVFSTNQSYYSDVMIYKLEKK